VLPNLPEELWDNHLGLYGEILPLLAAPITGYETDRVSMYHASIADETVGIAVAVRAAAGVRAYVHGSSPDTAAELVARCVEDAGPVAEVSAVDEQQALAVRRRLLPSASLVASIKLWTRSPSRPASDPDPYQVRELRSEDTVLFDETTFTDGTRGWPGFRACLESGLRYFGSFAAGRLVSVVGVCQLSRSRSEIIGVGTFRETDRRRGYAGAACRRALDAALEQSRVCTWTARADNAASIRAAESIGMRPYLTRFDLSAVVPDAGGRPAAL
jgi:RimJ/RimL family protein N-acetyltransferase